MKLTTIYRDILREVGDTTATYALGVENWELVDADSGEYIASRKFVADDGDEYTVIIEYAGDAEDNEWLPTIEVSFVSDDTGFGAKQQALSGQTFKVMATVMKAVKDFINKNEWVEAFSFNVSDPVKGDTTKKAKLYMAFIKKQFPNAKIQSYIPGEYKVIVRG